MNQLALRIITIVGAFGTFASHVQAGPIINQTFSGSFPATITATLPNQDTALLEMFTTPSISNLTITTTSYASGGFQPNLLLYSSTGSFVAAGVPFGAVASTGIIGDSRLTAPNLPAGKYTLAVTDFLLNQSLTATNLSDGFNSNFGSGTTFVDSNGNQRTGNVVLTIAGPVSGPGSVPEPATIWLAAPFLAGLVIRARKSV